MIKVVNRRMTPVIVDERMVCRSIVRVTLIIAGMSPEERAYCHAKANVHGELLIVMEDNVYC